jgi:hypothetical protein
MERGDHLGIQARHDSLYKQTGPRKPNHEDGFWNAGTISNIERTCGSLAYPHSAFRRSRSALLTCSTYDSTLSWVR